MEVTNITKDMLPQIDRIELALENCEEYSIKSEDILDIWFDEIQFGAAAYGENIVHNGRMVVSKNMFNQLSSFAHDADFIELDDGSIVDWDNGPIEDYYFCNRITKCCDVCQVHIYFKDGSRIWFFVDYDPIWNEMLSREIEYSNCPSAELNKNGDMLLLFGKSSHAFQRVDNDYYNVIEELRAYLPKKPKGTISGKIVYFANAGNDDCSLEGGLGVVLRIQNEECKNSSLPLQFFNISKLYFDFNLKYSSTEEFLISPTKNGKLFVQFGDKFNFYCKQIKTCGRLLNYG